MRLASGLITLLFLVGCASAPQNSNLLGNTEVLQDEQGDDLDVSILEAQQRAMDRLNSMSSEGNEEQPSSEPIVESGAQFVEPKYEMDTKTHLPKVQKWISYYSKKDRERFQRFLNRGARYKQVIQDLLVSNGLPPDLYYLGVLESGYVTEAISRAGAVGPWQFMGPTGRQYGLKINNYVDERIDPVRSTLAAIRYLKELYRLKKSWYMALAAYNAGPGRVRRAIRRGGTRNYWKLTRRRLLPYDTREYIPQFLAILAIGRDLDSYGFVEETENPLMPMELVKVPARVPLKKVAEVSGISLEEINRLNPHIRKQVTPPTQSHVYHLWVKKHHSGKLESQFANLEKHMIPGLRVQTRSVASAYRRVHRVRRGQNLSFIARRYGTSVSKIKKINGLRSNRIYVGQRLKVKGSTKKSIRSARLHKVRRGENLSIIARRYKTSVAKIKDLNDLSSGRIYVGQKLKLRGAISKKARRYKIRRGDNLYKIARKFGTTIHRLKSINNLRTNRIMRGQVLVIASN